MQYVAFKIPIEAFIGLRTLSLSLCDISRPIAKHQSCHVARSPILKSTVLGTKVKAKCKFWFALTRHRFLYDSVRPTLLPSSKKYKDTVHTEK